MSTEFNLDAILQEFNVDNKPGVSSVEADDSVTRVRQSLGLGRSLFRRRQSPVERHEQSDQNEESVDDVVDSEMGMGGNGNATAQKAVKPRKRILDSDDEENTPLINLPQHSSPTTSSPQKHLLYSSTNSENTDTPESSISDSDEDLPTTEDIISDFRKARLEALSAKVAAKSQPPPREATDNDDFYTAEGDAEHTHTTHTQYDGRDLSLSPDAIKRKPRRAGKKALDEMHRETQRMARNMGLKPEVKTARKIEMSSIFAKFGFNPQKANKEGTPAEEAAIPIAVETSPVMEEAPAEVSVNPRFKTVEAALPVRHATPNLDASSDEEELPSPSKMSTFYPQPQKNCIPQKTLSPRKVRFTLPATLSSDSDSDVEILPPTRTNLNTTTPDRQRTRRSALIRSLANIKSPGQKSPGRMTHKELEEMLSREAALQTANKREQRRTELMKMGIDVNKIVEKRDALEEAREEARRVREEEGGSESDEEYVDEEREEPEEDLVESGDESEVVSEDESGVSGDDEMEDIEEGDEDLEDGSGDEMEEVEEMPKKRQGVARIISDDEDEDTASPLIVPESTVESQRSNIPRLSDFQTTDDVSLSQFFDNTQLSGSTVKQTQQSNSPQFERTGTGLTQFFRSTALEDDQPPSGEDAAHNRMDLLRQKAAQGITDLGPDSIGFPVLTEAIDPPSPVPSAVIAVSEAEPDQPLIHRRILKRRNIDKPVAAEKVSEEMNEATKDFIEEQAEESEDDYAQWRSGDEDEENLDGVVEGLIDDETKINVKRTEQDIARLYMEDQLEMDEKVVKGLMHDIQNGGLRRRRGQLEMGDWDSDDEDEDADERRRRWELKREEMKRRMLEDENLGKLAANPKTQAFLNAISSTTLNFDDEPDFLGGEIIEDTKASQASRNLPNSIPVGESQSQSQDTSTSAEIQVPATSSGGLSRQARDRLVIDELTQIEDSQPLASFDDISLSEASDSENEETDTFVPDKVYTGFIDRAAQKRAARTISENQTRFAFKAVTTSSSPARVKRTAVSVIEADDESARKKIMKEVIGSKTIKRKAWGSSRGRGAVTFRATGGRGKENVAAEMRKKNADSDGDKRRRDMLMLMDSQNSFC